MANDLNQCNFIGRLGHDPEVRHTPNGDACANFSIAVGESWKDKVSGEKKEKTEWIRCVAWRQLGEICGEYLVKGSQVFVSGKMATRKWQDKDGQEKYTTEIVVNQMQMLGSRQGSSDTPREERKSEAAKTPASTGGGGGNSGVADFEDDIPFMDCSIERDVTWKRLRRI